MSNFKSEKSNILKFVPDKRIDLREFLQKVGVKNIERHVILVNGSRTTKDLTLEKGDEIIVLPVLRGG
ncbi:MAG TPA: MoaD/ThiS family protein [Candidatus Bathyarchaeia archaeon]|nr:MoaD/ThiS family protein [Candidatus Bathyarchaeia archaeon]